LVNLWVTDFSILQEFYIKVTVYEFL
jgi:hypothetical protein